jgi:hypothetical protein
VSLLYSIQELIDRTNEIRVSVGISGLIKRGLSFAVSPIYKSETFWLTVNGISAEYKSEASKPRISMDRLQFKVVTSNEEADLLETEGLYFRSYPTYFNHGLTLYRKWLDLGAIACCTFIDKEFAAISWVITSKKTQAAVNAAPIFVDYANKEVFPRSAWSNPKFRNLGIYYHTERCRNQSLLERGFSIYKSVVSFTNVRGRGISNAGGSKIIGTGKLARILWLTTWKETNFVSPIEWSQVDQHSLLLKEHQIQCKYRESVWKIRSKIKQIDSV